MVAEAEPILTGEEDWKQLGDACKLSLYDIFFSIKWTQLFILTVRDLFTVLSGEMRWARFVFTPERHAEVYAL